MLRRFASSRQPSPDWISKQAPDSPEGWFPAALKELGMDQGTHGPAAPQGAGPSIPQVVLPQTLMREWNRSQAIQATMPYGSLRIEQNMSYKITLDQPGQVPLSRTPGASLPSARELPIPDADRNLIALFASEATRIALHRLSHGLSQGSGEGVLMNLARENPEARQAKIENFLTNLASRHSASSPPKSLVDSLNQAVQLMKEVHDASTSTSTVAAAGSQGRGSPM